MRVPCSASSKGARSASVNTVSSAALRLRRTEVSPPCVASLVCTSVQKPQPLIWPARIFISSCVAADRVDSVMTLPVQAAQRVPAVDARSHTPSTTPPMRPLLGSSHVKGSVTPGVFTGIR
jgi:hypothetical protein